MIKRVISTGIVVVLLCVGSSVCSQETESPAIKLTKQGQSLYQDGKIQEAISLFRKATEIDPKEETPWLWLGIVHGKLNKKKEALDCWDKAIRINSKNVFSRVHKAVTLYKLDRFTHVDGAFQDALTIDPNNPIIYGFMLQIHMAMGQYDKAERDYIKYKELGGIDKFGHIYGLIMQALQRQFRGTNLPPKDWEPPQNYLPDLTMEKISSPWLEQLCTANVQHPKFILGGETPTGSTTENKRYRFVGSEEKPFEYAPGFYIWNATVIAVPQYGVLIMDGAKIKRVEVIGGTKKATTGEVKNW